MTLPLLSPPRHGDPLRILDGAFSPRLFEPF